MSPRWVWQRPSLPGAFSPCLAGKQTQARGPQQHSYSGAHFVFAVLSGVALLEKETPQTYAEAMASKDAAKWKTAMQAEIDGCNAQTTWKVVPRSGLPDGANVIPMKWVYKIKTDETGAVTKFKARITPKGFKQRHGIDYFEVFANTGKYKSLRVMLSLAASNDMELYQLDVPQAFTQAELDEVVYMEMPTGFALPGMVCLLLRSLYGLKQSPRNWYRLISVFIVTGLRFTATVSDPCVFWTRSRTGRLIWLFLFVDDMNAAVHHEDKAEWAEAHEKLRRRFNITDLGATKYLLGMRITRDRAARTITLDQELYVTKALEKFGLQHLRPVPTPGMDQEDSSDSSTGDAPTDLKSYQEKVGTLLYAAISVRPDIAYAVNKLCQKMSAPTVRDAKACDRVFRYLAGTKEAGLLFGRSSSSKGGPHVTVAAYADADWASDRTDRKSITGWVGLINGDPVSWASKKQKVVSQSTTEAELYAEAAAINETKWLSGLLSEIGLRTAGAPVVYGDNQSAQALSRNGIKSERTKHVAIKYAFIHDEVEAKRVELVWVPTAEQLADIFTKALPRVAHERLREQLMTSGRN
jgi:hypothetical protein